MTLQVKKCLFLGVPRCPFLALILIKSRLFDPPFRIFILYK
jgi:hypothetical protein